MQKRERSVEAVPALPHTPAKKNRYIPPIDWDNAPFTPEEAPDGRWGTNSKGDTYLSCSDGSYHYFNADGSYYYSSGKPGIPDADGRAIYISPSRERFYIPSRSPEDKEHGEFFEGIDWRTGHEKIYWQDSTGKIERTFRKHVKWLSIRLPRKYVTLDAETNRICIVDRDGVPIEDGSNRQENPWEALELERDVIAVAEIKIEVKEEPASDTRSEDGMSGKVEQENIEVEDLVVEVVDLTQANE